MDCRIHAVVVPVPAQGHINPMINLSKKLAAKGVTISFVLTHSWKNIIEEAHRNNSPDAFTHATQTLGLPINLVCIPDCLPGEFDRWKNRDKFYRSLGDLGTYVESLIISLNSSENAVPVSCIISDVYLSWASPLAKKLRLRSVALWTQSLAALSIFYHCSLGNTVWSQTESSIELPDLEMPLFKRDLPSTVAKSKEPFVDHIQRLTDTAMEALKHHDWVLGNSFSALESVSEEALRKKMNFICAGPFLPLAYLGCSDSRDLTFGTSCREEVSCLQWLDSRAPKSVLYVSFGSLMPVSPAQMQEIAMGIRESGYSFLWVARELRDSAASELLPSELLEIIPQRGLLVPWCAQMRVLSHPSIGGFLSHCGWNSIIESISFGVPLLGFPVAADQPTNCWMVADVWKSGLRLRDGSEDIVCREAVAGKVKRVMEDAEFRKAAEGLRDVATSSVGKGGSSDQALELVVVDLKNKGHSRGVVLTKL